ncbi:MAG: winged helix DNA-binding protein [Rhodobacteraceae bacterium]|nr:winged helix DNA-binding protein [Paracoccaceae bacterium]
MAERRDLMEHVTFDNAPRGVSLVTITASRLSRVIKSQVTHVVSRDGDLSLVAWRILVGLSLVPAASQRELVAFTATEQAQVSRVLKQMEEQGLLVSKSDETDLRVRIFSLTHAGQQKFQTLQPAIGALTDAIDGALSPEERLQFLSMCERITRAVQNTGDNRSTQLPPEQGRHQRVHMEELK